MFDATTIAHEHDRIDDVHAILKETNKIGEVTIDLSVREVLSGVDGMVTISLHKDGLDYLLVWYKDTKAVVFRNLNGVYKYKEVPPTQGQFAASKQLGNDEVKMRTGKFSKILNILKLEDSVIKKVQTELKADSKVYGIYSSRNFYNHYRQMDRLGICKSCMSKTPSNYSVALTTQTGLTNFNPVIAYEVDQRWDLLLIKDESNTETYPFVARAVRYEVNQDLMWYGRNHLAESVISAYEESKGAEVVGDSEPYLVAIQNEGSVGGFVLPYVDALQDAEFDGEELKLGYGSIQTSHSTGVGAEGWFCENCQETHSEDEHQYSFDGYSYCDMALGEVFVIIDCEEVGIDDAVFVESTGEYAYIDDVVWSDHVEEYLLSEDAVICCTDSEYYPICNNPLVCVDGDYYTTEDENIFHNEEEDEWQLA